MVYIPSAFVRSAGPLHIAEIIRESICFRYSGDLPSSADRTAALRQLRECVATANASIALEESSVEQMVHDGVREDDDESLPGYRRGA